MPNRAKPEYLEYLNCREQAESLSDRTPGVGIWSISAFRVVGNWGVNFPYARDPEAAERLAFLIRLIHMPTRRY